MEQCALAAQALSGDEGAGGVVEGLRLVEGFLTSVLSQEEANAAALQQELEGGGPMKVSVPIWKLYFL